MASLPTPQAQGKRPFFAAPPSLDPIAKPPPSFHQPAALPSASSSSSAPAQRPAKRARTAAAPNGNYKGYYARRRGAGGGGGGSRASDAADERLALVPAEWIKGKRVLDVGCNAGAVTVEMAQRAGAAKVTGVDIDPELVRAARKHADLAWSRQAPLSRLLEEAAHLSSSSSRSSSQAAPLLPLVLDESTSPFVPSSSSYFPSSLARMFGFLPSPRSAPGLLTTFHPQAEVETAGVLRRGKRKVMPREVRAFPENVRFVCADWVNDEIPDDREGYEVIVAFSVTKWIHLHTLNAGLLTFFRRAFDALLPGGRLLLEPQPFSTYARSARADPLLQANYARLREGAEKGWKAEEGDFERVLIELVGFEKRELLGETGRVGSTFRRPVEVYTKRGGGSWGV
ncbi:hypothetical protein JCM10449v2_007055 [Rhodotorula kratochvilovae]